MRAAIRDTVEAIAPFDELEQRDRAETLDWIDRGEELFRRAKPATPPRHLVSYCVVRSGSELLLVDHLKALMWVPSGGHVDPEEHPDRTAEREVLEELGIRARVSAPAFITITTTVGTTAGHEDVSLWYDIEVPRDVALEADTAEFSRTRWFSMDALPVERMDPNLTRYVAKLRR